VRDGCAAGRRPNVSVITEVIRKTAGSMRRQSGNAADDDGKRIATGSPEAHLVPTPRTPIPWSLCRARGHAVKRFRKIFATGRDATSRYALPAVLRLITAATRAAKPCVACWIGSASTSNASVRRLPSGQATKNARRNGIAGRQLAAWRPTVVRGQRPTVGRASAAIGTLLKRRYLLAKLVRRYPNMIEKRLPPLFPLSGHMRSSS